MRDDDKREYYRGRSDVTFYSGLMPKTVYRKLHRDANMFDRMWVGSYQTELFTQGTGVLPKRDPVLIGEYQGQYYLGAIWGLDEEMKRTGVIG